MNIMNNGPVGRRLPALLRGFGLALSLGLLGGVASHAQTAMSVIYPAGGERCVAGAAEKIEWTTTGEGNVQIMLWNGEDGTWSTIASDIPASQGYYWWTSPEELRGETFRVKVESTSDAGYALSPAYFYVVDAEPLEMEKGMSLETPALAAATLAVLPNPVTSGVARIAYTGAEPIRLALRDMLGNTLREIAPIAGSATVSTTGLPNGTYLVEAVYRDGMRRTAKLVVER